MHYAIVRMLSLALVVSLSAYARDPELVPERPARTSIALTPAMLQAHMLKTRPDGQRVLEFAPHIAVRECTEDTPIEQQCAYFDEGVHPHPNGAGRAPVTMHAPVDPVNLWWEQAKQRYPSAASAITDCAQVKQRKCVTMDDVHDPLAWRRAWDACGAVCTIVVKPGVYEIGYYDVPWIVKRADVHVIGVKGEDGAKPVIRGKLTPLRKAKAADSDAQRQAYPATMLGWRETNKDLTLENIAFERCGECLNGGSRSLHKQVWRLIDVDVRWCRAHCIMIGWEEAGREDDEIYIHGGEFAYGGGNHVVYLDRTLYQEVIGARIHSPGALHAIKAIGLTINLIGNVFSSVRPDGSAEASPGLSMKWNLKEYAGSAPLSLIACQRGVIAYNTVVWRYDGWGSGSSPALRQPRKAVGGCDVPLETQPAFWKRVQAQGTHYPKNIHNALALPMYWYANRFVLVARNTSENEANRSVRALGAAFAIRNQSTHPVRANPEDAGDWKPYPLATPAGWIERAFDFIAGNCFENFLPGNITSGLLTATMRGADGAPIDPGKRQWVIGENTCKHLSAKPAWFPERLPVMTRAEYEAGAAGKSGQHETERSAKPASTEHEVQADAPAQLKRDAEAAR